MSCCATKIPLDYKYMWKYPKRRYQTYRFLLVHYFQYCLQLHSNFSHCCWKFGSFYSWASFFCCLPSQWMAILSLYLAKSISSNRDYWIRHFLAVTDVSLRLLWIAILDDTAFLIQLAAGAGCVSPFLAYNLLF